MQLEASGVPRPAGFDAGRLHVSISNDAHANELICQAREENLGGSVDESGDGSAARRGD
tara:strand:- start:833 stop:1009 length:177 start_codon:yes stop_codon:yes gene_type:complete